MLQLRPIGSEGPFYSPYRDIAYIGKDIIEKALCFIDTFMIDEKNRELVNKKFSEDDIKQMISYVGSLADMIHSVSENKNFSPIEEILKHITQSLENKNVQFVTSSIGITFVYAYITCLRDQVLDDNTSKYLDTVSERLDNMISKWREYTEKNRNKQTIVKKIFNFIRRKK